MRSGSSLQGKTRIRERIRGGEKRVFEEHFAEEVRLLYVGMTRATHELHLSAHGASPFVESVEAAITRL